VENKLLAVALIGCVPSIFYLIFVSLKGILRLVRRYFPYEGATQFALVFISLLCFGFSLFLVVWNFITPIPYYHREKFLMLALLSLLLGVFCLQVLQFIRLEIRQQHPRQNVSSERVRENQRRSVRTYVVSNSKS